MSKNKVEENINYETPEFEIDEDSIREVSMREVSKLHHNLEGESNASEVLEKSNTVKNNALINCLRKERVIVRHIPKEGGMITNPKHVLYGGMAENASRTFVVPRLSSGMFVNVLTDAEKAFLEEIMGLEYNSLSIYKKVDNFWDDSNENGISKVTLKKAR